MVANFSPTESGNLSTLFDVGGIIGGVIAGVISDYSGMSATTCAGMLTVAIPMVRLRRGQRLRKEKIDATKLFDTFGL